VPPPTIGVNLAGYFRAESGVGEHSRLLLALCDEAGIPTVPLPFGLTRSRQEHRFTAPLGSTPEYPINLVSVNADQVPVFAREIGDDFFAGRWNLGFWAWEVEEFPGWMAESAGRFDEIWANSRHAADAISRRVAKPVLAFPLPIEVPRTARRGRAELGLPEGFLFLSSFDYDSVFERKNPLAVIAAFARAFPRAGTASLVIKTINAEFHPDRVARLSAAIDGRSDIRLVDGYRSRAGQLEWLAAADAFVSLHRAEGFGLQLGEAMALGKPVIATAYSGNLDFMTADTSRLVPCELVAIPPDSGPYSGRWAEPDVAAAAEAMRSLAGDPAAARALGERARHHVASEHSLAVRARRLRQELERAAASAAGRTRGAGAPADFTTERIRPFARAVVEHGPDPGRGGLAGRLRALVLRLARPLLVHQRRVDGALLDLVAAEHLETGAALAARRDELRLLEGEIRRLERRLEAGRE
jgi:glycosyltransferase involved in cell wall biosynthesis